MPSLPLTTYAQTIPASSTENVASVTNYAPSLDHQAADQAALQGVNELSVKAKELGVQNHAFRLCH